jgi:hypothetical protein
VTDYRVMIAGPPIPQETVKQALVIAGLDGAEVTLRRGDGLDGGCWHVTIATGSKVTAGAVPADDHSAERLGGCLRELLRGEA